VRCDRILRVDSLTTDYVLEVIMGKEKIGKQIKLIGKHPWSGETGHVISFEKMGVLPVMAYKIKLSNGTECFAKPEFVKEI
jgi:hypothetical protein